MATASRPLSPTDFDVNEDEFRQLVVHRLGLLEDALFDPCVAVSRKLRLPLFSVLVERARIPPGSARSSSRAPMAPPFALVPWPRA